MLQNKAVFILSQAVWELSGTVISHGRTRQDLPFSLSVNQLGVLMAHPGEINGGCSSLK